jgi:hypothetical protein
MEQVFAVLGQMKFNALMQYIGAMAEHYGLKEIDTEDELLPTVAWIKQEKDFVYSLKIVQDKDTNIITIIYGHTIGQIEDVVLRMPTTNPQQFELAISILKDSLEFDFS